MDTLTPAALTASISSLWSAFKKLPSRPARVLTAIAGGRRELAWEVGVLSQAAANGTATPVIGITVNNDADFISTRAYVFCVGVAGAGIPIPAGVTIQVRDSATGDVFLRQPASPLGFMNQGYAPGSPMSSGRFVSAPRAWAAPHVLKKGSSVLFEFANPNAYTFPGDLYVIYEGYRVYTKEKEIIRSTYEGQIEPFDWVGSLVVPDGLPAGVQSLGTIAMPGPDQNRYILESGAIIASGVPTAVGGVQLFPEDVLLMNAYDTRGGNKLWARVSTPLPFGQAMPAKCFTGGGPGGPWAWPRYLEGTDQLYFELWGDPSAWVAGNPGTIEMHFNGFRIYG